MQTEMRNTSVASQDMFKVVKNKLVKRFQSGFVTHALES